MSLKPKEQTLTEHLSDLRVALIRSLIAVLCAFVVAWFFSDKIFDFLRAPVASYLHQGLVYTGVMDKFIAHLKVSIFAAVILASPFWLYQIWWFISPGLYKEEKGAAAVFLFFGITLFLSGVSFAYYIVYPLAFDFLFHFAGTADTPMITINEYLSFMVTTSLAFGAMFELPVVLTLLAFLGIIDADFLSKYRRYSIVLIAVLSAVVTPPDVISMVLMMVPMLFLYEISIWSCKWVSRKKKFETLSTDQKL